MNKPTDHILSDVQSDQQPDLLALDWVGMSAIQTQILYQDFHLPAQLNIGVNLKQGHRGIHMSRLYQLHLEHLLNKKISTAVIFDFLDRCLQSQGNQLSSSAEMSLRLSLPRTTQSLKSHLLGFRQYPIDISARIDHEKKTAGLILKFEILYSSTCPQSLKLSKELFQSQISADEVPAWLNSDAGYPATPHAQRSRLSVEILTNKNFELDFEKWIALCEGALGTPVQTTVKKADEMEFARLNAENPLFCEDAVRLVALVLKAQTDVQGFQLRTSHEESLHSHDASSRFSYRFHSLS